MTDTTYVKHERRCDGCGEAFWGTARAMYCSQGCRQRAHRAKQPYGFGASELTDLCARLLRATPEADPTPPRKLLPRLFRAVAKELRLQGWDPIEVLLSQQPDDPVSDDDTAPGGIEGEPGERRKWLYPPEEELRRIEEQIVERVDRGGGVGWYMKRREQLVRLLDQRRASGG